MSARPPFFATRLRARIRDAARRSALGAAGLFMVLLGSGFLLAALWTALAQMLDSLLASALMGAVLAGIGLILLGVASRPASTEKPPRQSANDDPDTADDPMLRRLLHEAGLEVPPKGQTPPIVDAFLFGLFMALRFRQQTPPRGHEDAPPDA